MTRHLTGNAVATSDMSTIILIPGLLCAIALCFRSAAWVFRWIVLPTLLLLPLYWTWKIALLPPIDFSDAVLLPLGIAMCLRNLSRWRFSMMDFWLLLFAFSQGAGDRSLGQSTASVFEFFDSLCKVIIPYMAGKLLIEQEFARALTLEQIVTFTAGAGLLGTYEFRGLNNLWRMSLSPFFKGQTIPWATQIRGGAGRLSGPYAQAELAGMMLVVATLFSFFLARHYDWARRFRSLPNLHLRKSFVVAFVLLIALYMTQSRGPELGLIFAIPVAFIGRSKRVLRTTLIVFLCMVIGGAAAYEGLTRYASTKAPTSEEQETAAYRTIMLDSYLPRAEHSGPWGLGPHFATIGKYKSIDNEYLFVALTNGYIGFGSFVLICCGTLVNLTAAALYQPEQVDRAFAFTLLGIFSGLLVTIATVYLGFQPLIFFFLLVGWAQAVRVHRTRQPHAVFQQVYT